MERNQHSVSGAVEQWLNAFEAALTHGDAGAATDLFLSDGQWRDILAFSWNIQSVFGRSGIEVLLNSTLEKTRPMGFGIDPRFTPPRRIMRAGVEVIEAFISFVTRYGRGNGVLRLVAETADQNIVRAWTLSTALTGLTGFEEQIGRRRPTGPSDLRDFGSENWLDLRRRTAAFADRDPAVLIVGAGQAGLSIAARLGVLGVDALVIDRHIRVGDNWRNRYHALTLHNEVFVNDLPYMPFPASFPNYIAKDKLANWLEFYADAMEINCWSGTQFVSGAYDDRRQCWSVELRRADGTTRFVNPRHLVLAVGASPIAHIPELPGLDSFSGTWMHSEHYTSGTAWSGRRALVLGTGTSGHDVAQDLVACGAKVTLIQRNPTYVVSLRQAQGVYKSYSEGLPIEECDLLGTSYPYKALLRVYEAATAESTRNDRQFLDELSAAGFRLDLRKGDTGFQPRYFERGGGYYFNVGCSNLIINGTIGLIQFDALERFVPEGVLMRNGTIVAADLVVLATGYLSQQDVTRRLLGNEIADKIGPVWGLGADGELRNMWVRTPQKGLWFHAGSLPQCRIFSRYLALQIKACEEGLIPLTMPARIESPAAVEAERRECKETRPPCTGPN